MKVLVLGGGGREHAIVWKLRQGAAVERVWCAPGNSGIANDAECVPVDVGNVNASADLAAGLGADLTVVGPELPLVSGVADEFASRGLALLGPTKAAAQLEGSKVFAKEFMQRHDIPTAALYGIHDSEAEARGALSTVEWPLAIKADGLCAGKGVLVADSRDDAAAFIARALGDREFGEAGKRVLFEEGLVGEELSYIILTDGDNFIPMAPTRDHKRAFDGDAGPNTGGMGAYSADSLLDPALEKQMAETIVQPTLAALRADAIPYRGFLYFGLMLTRDGPKVLEFNCRLGDPETQAIMLRADFDLAEACAAAARGGLGYFRAKWKPGASCCVVLASEGYPGTPKTARIIRGLEEAAQVPGAVIFHAATRRSGVDQYTSGGRVLAAGASASNLHTARKICYDSLGKIALEGGHYRRDIGWQSSQPIAAGERRANA